MTLVHHRTPWQWIVAIVGTIVTALVLLPLADASVDGMEILTEPRELPLDPNRSTAATVPAGWSFDVDGLLGYYPRLAKDDVEIVATYGYWYGDIDRLGPRAMDQTLGDDAAAFGAPLGLSRDTVDALRYDTATDRALVLQNTDSGDVIVLVAWGYHDTTDALRAEVDGIVQSIAFLDGATVGVLVEQESADA